MYLVAAVYIFRSPEFAANAFIMIDSSRHGENKTVNRFQYPRISTQQQKKDGLNYNTIYFLNLFYSVLEFKIFNIYSLRFSLCLINKALNISLNLYMKDTAVIYGLPLYGIPIQKQNLSLLCTLIIMIMVRPTHGGKQWV